MTEMSTLIARATLMLHQARASNQTPVAFAMNPDTAKLVAAEAQIQAQARRSALGRLTDRLRGTKSPETLRELLGVPVVLIPQMPPGQIGLQTLCARPPVAEDKPMPEFEKREKPTEGDAPTLGQLAKGDKLTPTAILIAAMDDIDAIKHVVVVRVHHDDSVDLCLSANQFEAQGILQKAQYWLATRD